MTGGQTKAYNNGFQFRSRLGVDRLATPLGIYEILAFRDFDKTIISGHWLSKTQKLALASEAFRFEKGIFFGGYLVATPYVSTVG